MRMQGFAAGRRRERVTQGPPWLCGRYRVRESFIPVQSDPHFSPTCAPYASPVRKSLFVEVCFRHYSVAPHTQITFLGRFFVSTTCALNHVTQLSKAALSHISDRATLLPSSGHTSNMSSWLIRLSSYAGQPCFAPYALIRCDLMWGHWVVRLDSSWRSFLCLICNMHGACAFCPQSNACIPPLLFHYSLCQSRIQMRCFQNSCALIAEYCLTYFD